MYSTLKFNFLSKEAITEKDYAELIALLKTCQEVDSVNIKLELDYKLSRAKTNRSDTNKKTEFFCYFDDTLISYLGICNFGGELNELTGLTHPNWRRQNIFKQLLHMAVTEMKIEKQTKLLLLSDHNSSSGTAFLAATGACYSYSEYGMKLMQYSTPTRESQVSLRKAQIGDLVKINRLDHTFFADPIIEDAEQEEGFNKLLLDSTYLIYKDNNLIGKICVDMTDSFAFIYGFGIINDYRGKGFGTQALQATIALIYSKGITAIGLDVAAANERALHIYTSCGFEKQSVMDYYELNI